MMIDHDHSTRWPEAVPLGCIDVDNVLEAFITMLVACFGVPVCITTDRGMQFNSGAWGDWCQKQGVQHITNTAYHPQANCMVEQIHHTLKAALCAEEGQLPGKTTCPGFCWACGLPLKRSRGYQWQKWLYNSSWWRSVSCRRPVSNQQE